MPVSLLEHIISQSFESVKKIEIIIPSEDLREYIDSFYVFPCCNLSDTLAYNDGTPMLAFLPTVEDSVELEYNHVISSFKSGWFSTRSFARMSIRLSGQVPYLLIVRFKPASFYRILALNARHFNTRPFWNLEVVLGDTDALLKDMQQCAEVGEKIQLIETYLRGVILAEENSNRLLDEAIYYIRQHKGTLSIDELKSHLGVNYKWLERNFSEAMGMTPKQYSSLQRFINAYTAFWCRRICLVLLRKAVIAIRTISSRISRNIPVRRQCSICVHAKSDKQNNITRLLLILSCLSLINNLSLFYKQCYQPVHVSTF